MLILRLSFCFSDIFEWKAKCEEKNIDRDRQYRDTCAERYRDKARAEKEREVAKE